MKPSEFFKEKISNEGEQEDYAWKELDKNFIDINIIDKKFIDIKEVLDIIDKVFPCSSKDLPIGKQCDDKDCQNCTKNKELKEKLKEIKK